jgi:hypothetical protein
VTYPHRSLLLLLVAAGISEAAETGRLTAACSDQEHCRWLVRFQPSPTRNDQKAISAALKNRKAVQPIQIAGDEASVLVMGESDFEVVFLKRKEQGWEIVKVVRAPEGQKERSPEERAAP